MNAICPLNWVFHQLFVQAFYVLRSEFLGIVIVEDDIQYCFVIHDVKYMCIRSILRGYKFFNNL